MIVSRSALKEIRSKQSTVQKGKSEPYQSGNKKTKTKDEGFIKNVKMINKPQESEKQNFKQNTHSLLFQDDESITPGVDLSRSSIKQFKFDLKNELSLKQIRSLNLSHNDIREILPTILIPFQFLQYLNLTDNKLSKISFPYNKMSLKHLIISQNKIVNLNLQHLKCLETVDASHNRLIFITLPESIKTINLDHNMLANTYFIEKCSKVQTLSMNFNFIYDLNFNSMSELENVVKRKSNDKLSRFSFLKRVECSNNKICHLNGFKNLNCLQTLQMDNNEIPLNKQNMSQLLLLEGLTELSMMRSRQESLYSLEQFSTILFDNLPNLKLLNSQQKNTIVFYEQQQAQCIVEQSDRQDFHLYQSSSNKTDLNNQSTIRQNQLSALDCCPGEKPFRLFLDDQCSEQHQSDLVDKNQQLSFQRIYTLGDMEDQEEQVNEGKSVSLREKQDCIQQQYDSFQFQEKALQKPNKKLQQLQQQFFKPSSTSRILLPIAQHRPLPPQFQITTQTRTLFKMLYEMSFIPPLPIKNSSKTLLISKRLDQDEDEYFLFSKLFQRQNGIMYLKKIFLLQEGDMLFMNGEDEEVKKDYGFGFFNGANLDGVYKKMMKNQCLLSELIDDKVKSNLANYMSPIPGAFGCHNIAVRYLNKKASAFDSRNLTPTCYLIESKKL